MASKNWPHDPTFLDRAVLIYLPSIPDDQRLPLATASFLPI